MLDQRQSALVELGLALRGSDYRFVSPTPETHRRVLARPGQREDGPTAEARLLRDAFGWSRPFVPSRLPPGMLAACETAQILEPQSDGLHAKSRVRFSTLELAGRRHLFVHSAYPTTAADAVFFGPDSYRFAAAVARTVKTARRLVDIGCGTGVGGLVLADRAAEVVLADVSPRALEFAAVNLAIAAHAGTCVAEKVTLCQSDVLAGVPGQVDVVVANPPYLVGPEGEVGSRLYRDGGGALGIELAARIAAQSLDRLVAGKGGQLLLYTGVPIIEGENVLQRLLEDRLQPSLRRAGARLTWEELDPDVFGEELERPCYGRVERLAAVLLTAQV